MAEPTKQRAEQRLARQSRLVRWMSLGAVVVVAGLIAWGLLIARPAASTAGPGGETCPIFMAEPGRPRRTLPSKT